MSNTAEKVRLWQSFVKSSEAPEAPIDFSPVPCDQKSDADLGEMIVEGISNEIVKLHWLVARQSFSIPLANMELTSTKPLKAKFSKLRFIYQDKGHAGHYDVIFE